MTDYKGDHSGEGRTNLPIKDSYKKKLIKIKEEKKKDEPYHSHSNTSTLQYCIDYVFNLLFSSENEVKK